MALNAERAEEERRGLVRWLRPEYRAPRFAPAKAQESFDVSAGPVKAKRRKWPGTLPEQVQAARGELAAATAPIDAGDIARAYSGARGDRVREVLATLAALGQARDAGNGRYSA